MWHRAKGEEVGRWWERSKPIPDTINDERNFVLYPADLAEYLTTLTSLVGVVDKERTRVLNQLRAMEKGGVLSYLEPLPLPYTLCDWLQFNVNLGKVKLQFLQWSVEMLKRRTNSLGERNGLGTQSVVSNQSTDA